MVFGQKWPFLQLPYFKQNRPGKCLLRYSRIKKIPFLGFKNKKFKKSKNCHYSKWVNPLFLYKKNFHFSNFFFFRQYRPGKCLLQYSRTKRRLSRPKKQKDQTVKKIDIFPKGLTHSFGPKFAIFQTFFLEPNRPVKCLLRYSRI